MYKMIENQDIIIISNQMLNDHYWTSKQYITMELIKKNRVLYVEANYSFGKLFFGIMLQLTIVQALLSHMMID